jgi:molecular chaperone GrpE (heat shock protein)
MKNIVEFPKNKIFRDAPVNIELIEKAKEKALASFADSVVETMIDNLLEGLDNFGLDTQEETFIKDFSLTVDAIRATVYRSLGIPHQLHEFIDDNVKLINRITGEMIDSDEVDNEVDSKD